MMTNSAHSSSEPVPAAPAPAAPDRGAATPSTAYELYHPSVQRWIYDSGWERLRDAQERAAAPILAGDHDMIIAAATASGKTEAAWLPICSALVRQREAGEAGPGVQALFISPLKALINDQYDRMTRLCERLDIPVHRWHGDVPASRKSFVMRAPDGVLLITPESMEAMFVNHGDRIGRVLGDLRYVVIDELHSFVGTERGAQLQSLLHRVELCVRHGVPRIALSATLGDFTAAAEFLRPGKGSSVQVVSSDDDAGEIRLQLRGYRTGAPRRTGAPPRTGSPRTDPGDNVETHDIAPIADHLFHTLREHDNLIFANTRAAVETYADMLNRRSRATKIPAEFLAHHGSLAKEIREYVEERLKDRSTPVTAICTSTLEMGIDVGTVDSIAQIGAPPTVSSLRQRLGRSGRREDQPAVIRIYVSECELSDRTPPPDALRGELFQTMAMVELLLASWYEPPHAAGLHLSTLIQQILSVLAQHGAASVAQVHQVLCGQGPFAHVGTSTFGTLLRDMGRHDLIRQDSRGFLLPGGQGDRLVNHYSFYAAFHTSQDYRLVADGRTLGSLPVERPILPGTLLIFSGRRWRVLGVDIAQRVIELTGSGDGQPPTFPGSGGEVADKVRRTMRALYQSEEIPRYLDSIARTLLGEGREVFRRFGHADQSIFGWGNETLLFPWRGDRIMNTLLVTLASQGLNVGQDGVCLTVKGTSPTGLWTLIHELAGAPQPDPLALADSVRAKPRDKYDRYLGADLLNLAYAARALDVPAAWAALADLANLPRPHDPPGTAAHDDDERWDLADFVLRPEAGPHDRTGG
jgi:ATP-dependent helicase Lhr and Lhr-like helicase